MADRKKRRQKRSQPEEDWKEEKVTKGITPCFLFKVYDILEIIAWVKDGSGFVVKRPNEFAENVLPKYFKHRNFASFVRQLNMYDFHKRKDGNSENGFWHPLFKRGSRQLIPQIRRKTPPPETERPERTERSRGSMNDLEEVVDQLEARVAQLESRERDYTELQSNHQKVCELNNMLKVLLSVFLRQHFPRKELASAPSPSPESPSPDPNTTMEPNLFSKDSQCMVQLSLEDLARLCNMAYTGPGGAGGHGGLLKALGPALPMIEPAYTPVLPTKQEEERKVPAPEANYTNESFHLQQEGELSEPEHMMTRNNETFLLSPLGSTPLASPFRSPQVRESPLYSSEPNPEKLPKYLSAIEGSPFRYPEPVPPSPLRDGYAAKEATCASPLLGCNRPQTPEDHNHADAEEKPAFTLSPPHTSLHQLLEE